MWKALKSWSQKFEVQTYGLKSAFGFLVRPLNRSEFDSEFDCVLVDSFDVLSKRILLSILIGSILGVLDVFYDPVIGVRCLSLD